ncbi:MAG: amidohydrolase family protein [Nitratireductor sp.]|nr:amidohydrolase family protein [Nitratireductor sp.]
MNRPQSVDLIVTDAMVYCFDDENTFLPDGAIAVAGSRIVDVGPTDEILKAYQSSTVLDGQHFLAMPGLVNTHNHTPLTITRGMIEDLSFAPIYTKSIPQGHLLSASETLALARLGMYELLKAGCTTVVDFYRHPKMLAQAADEMGMRAVITGRIHDVDLDELASRNWVHRNEIGDATLQETCDLIDAWHGKSDGRIRCDVGAHGTDTCTPGLLRRVRELAEKQGGNVHIHLAHAKGEVNYVHERDGISPACLVEEVGLLNERLIAAHCVFLDEEDRKRVGRAGIGVAHAPHQNAPAGNSAPIRDLIAEGAHVSLCTDSRSADMFEAMRLAGGSWRMKNGGYEPKAKTLLDWAIGNGARQLGMQNEIGRIAKGYKADIIFLDRLMPNLTPIVDGYGILAYSASAGNVDTVIIDGRIRLRDKRPVGFDAHSVVSEAQTVSEKLWARYGYNPVTRS